MNPVNWWLVVPLVLSQVAGVAGFVLGVINLNHAKQLREDAKNAPARADQRRYREQLREILHLARQECEAAGIHLSIGSHLSDEVPPEISEAGKKLSPLKPLLVEPELPYMYQIQLFIERVDSNWRDVIRVERNIKDTKHRLAEEDKPVVVSDELIRKRHVAETALRESIKEFCTTATEMIDRTIQLDKA